jgi:hypothetical protein
MQWKARLHCYAELFEAVLSGGKPARDKLLHIRLPSMLESQLQDNEFETSD